jgi:hypothetical protein
MRIEPRSASTRHKHTTRPWRRRPWTAKMACTSHGASRTRTGDLLGAIGPGSVWPGSPRLVQVPLVESGSLRFAQFGITSGSTDVDPADNWARSSAGPTQLDTPYSPSAEAEALTTRQHLWACSPASSADAAVLEGWLGDAFEWQFRSRERDAGIGEVRLGEEPIDK